MIYRLTMVKTNYETDILDDVQNSSDSDNDESGSDIPDDDFNSEEDGDSDKGAECDDEDSEPEAESDADDDNHDEDEESGGNPAEDDQEGNVGWADAMAKVLAMGKNSDKPVSILSKAKKDNVKRKKVPGDKKDGDSSNEDQDEEQKLEPLAVRKAKKKEIDSIGRSFPNVLERNAEKTLSKIATRGVVTFFNTVREHQKDMKTKLKEAGGSIRKQEKVYKNLDKNSFVQMLTGKSVSQSEPSAKKVKIDVKDEENEDADKPSWNILRDDYMLGAKMKDWDKESDEEL